MHCQANRVFLLLWLFKIYVFQRINFLDLACIKWTIYSENKCSRQKMGFDKLLGTLTSRKYYIYGLVCKIKTYSDTTGKCLGYTGDSQNPITVACAEEWNSPVAFGASYNTAVQSASRVYCPMCRVFLPPDCCGENRLRLDMLGAFEKLE